MKIYGWDALNLPCYKVMNTNLPKKHLFFQWDALCAQNGSLFSSAKSTCFPPCTLCTQPVSPYWLHQLLNYIFGTFSLIAFGLCRFRTSYPGSGIYLAHQKRLQLNYSHSHHGQQSPIFFLRIRETGVTRIKVV
jgi:hypothetical protein